MGKVKSNLMIWFIWWLVESKMKSHSLDSEAWTIYWDSELIHIEKWIDKRWAQKPLFSSQSKNQCIQVSGRPECKDDGIAMARIREIKPMEREIRFPTSSSRTEQLLRDGKCFLFGVNSEWTKGAKNIDERKNMSTSRLTLFARKTDGWKKVKETGLKTKCVVPGEAEMLSYWLVQALENNPRLNQINSDCPSSRLLSDWLNEDLGKENVSGACNLTESKKNKNVLREIRTRNLE